ncbi:hypothetical protein [Daejeonella lutea]|uniref:Dolichyl-phosphate-mannose-protein mannosyltransferase n=1 Tax=Daejeonella lutea TaxID=572036 RepID=A0A1T5FBM2_9SPHI|nr:hypothetical protein [Daejeonella lutea]SKB93550.1 hypothetical protein SAMN05661099_3571 [Daejeonella lutea]
MKAKSILISDPLFFPTEKKSLSSRVVCKLVVLLSYLMMAGFSVYELSPAILLSYIIFGFAGLVITFKIDRQATGIFLTVYALCTLFATLLYFHYFNIYGTPYWSGGSDELEYERLGKEFADKYGILEYGSIRGNLVPLWHNSVGYIYLVGLLTKLSQTLGGEHTMVVRIFNSGCLSMISVMVYCLAKRLDLRNNIAFWAAMFAGCLPLMMWTAGQSLRDILVSMLLFIGIFVWSPDHSGKQKYPLFYILVVTLFLALFLFELRRAQAFVLLLVATIGLLTGSDKRYRWVRILWILLMSLIGIWMVIKFSAILNSDFKLILMSSDAYSTYRTEERGGGLSTIVFSSSPPWSYFLRTAYALVSPLPVISYKLYVIWLSIGTIVHIFYLPFFFKGISVSIRNKSWWIVLSGLVMLFIGMAMFTFTSRHITQYLPLAVLITALGYSRYRGVHKNAFFRMGGIIGVMCFLYVGLKMLTS